MERLVVEIHKFSLAIDDLILQNKVSKEDFEEFQKRLIKYPEEGDVIQGTSGLRKTRLKSSTKGKRGGFRVCYLDVPEKAKLFLILIYAKNVREDLSADEKRVLKSLVEKLKRE